MGFTINEKINAELHYKDVAAITMAVNTFQETHKGKCDSEVMQRMTRLVNRLGVELYDYPPQEKPVKEDLKTGIHAFSEERIKQVTKYGFSGKHHAEHPEWYSDDQLTIAATILLQKFIPSHYPLYPKNWDKEWFHRLCGKSFKERLVIAGALLAAECDRLEYLEKLKKA